MLSLIHIQNDFFPEECYVTAYGELFEDCEGAYSTFGDAIKLWCEKTGVSQEDVYKRQIQHIEAVLPCIQQRVLNYIKSYLDRRSFLH